MIDVFVVLLLFFVSIYFLLIFLFVLGVIQPEHRNLQNTQRLTLVVPFRNEEKNLPLLFSSIQNQNLHEFDLILIDDHSTDHSLKYAQEFQFREGIVSTIISDWIGAGKKEALKFAIGKVKTNQVVITDADCVFSIDWLSQHQQNFCTENAFVIGGVSIIPTGFFSSVQCFDQLALTASAIGAAKVGLPFMCSAANLSFSKTDFLSADLLNKKSSGDDVFLLHHKKRNGGKEIVTLMNSESLVSTKSELTVRNFLNQRLRWAGKSTSISDPFTLTVAGIVLMTNLLMLVGLGISAIHPPIIPYLFFSVLTKGSIDFLLLFLTRRQLKIKVNFFYFFPSFVFQICYVPIVGIVSFVWKPNWKGRSVN